MGLNKSMAIQYGKDSTKFDDNT